VPASSHHLLLTGAPGVGKTTAIRRVAERLPKERLGGFCTEEIREGGMRQGFRLLSLDGREWGIAHTDLPKRYRVGKYGVDVLAMDAAAERLLTPRPGLDVYLVDEIGKMECFSARFIAAMRHLLDSDKTVVATIGKKGAGFIAEVKQRSDCRLWEITFENRDEIPDRVRCWLQDMS
jgi:nucleoside-triphosphatase